MRQARIGLNQGKQAVIFLQDVHIDQVLAQVAPAGTLIPSIGARLDDDRVQGHGCVDRRVVIGQTTEHQRCIMSRPGVAFVAELRRPGGDRRHVTFNPVLHSPCDREPVLWGGAFLSGRCIDAAACVLVGIGIGKGAPGFEIGDTVGQIQLCIDHQGIHGRSRSGFDGNHLGRKPAAIGRFDLPTGASCASEIGPVLNRVIAPHTLPDGRMGVQGWECLPQDFVTNAAGLIVSGHRNAVRGGA